MNLFDAEPSGRQPIEVPDEYYETHWQSKDGRVTKITELDDTHLFNIIKMLWLSRFEIKENLIEISMSWGEPNGEQAQYAFWGEIDAMQKADEEDFLRSQVVQWDNLIKEAEERNINWRHLIDKDNTDYCPVPFYVRADKSNSKSSKSKQMAQDHQENRKGNKK